jgi:hypothetical protein
MERVDWDEFADRYDRVFLQDPLYVEMLRTLVEQVDMKGGARVLAIGGKFVYGDHFTDVEGAHRDPARCRDIIEKTVGRALFALDGGGYDQMLGLLRVLPLCLAEDGEYLETPARWRQLLEDEGFGDFSLLEVPPVGFGIKILVASRLR